MNEDQEGTLLNYGLVLWKLNQIEQACNEFNKIFEQNPDNEDALWNMGLVNVQLSKYSEALKYFDRLYKAKGYDIELYLELSS
ncbi:tetratricopeptide repeat protein [Paenibacillus sp. KS1]|uniref:tetratricopeptide repeat protein n=1 Tax=Paenibacillus sp. KS1 TaxID=1849249 RepID=UPI001586127A